MHYINVYEHDGQPSDAYVFDTLEAAAEDTRECLSGLDYSYTVEIGNDGKPRMVPPAAIAEYVRISEDDERLEAQYHAGLMWPAGAR